MKGMIEFRPDLIYAIFGIMAAGFVILTLPIGILVHHLVAATGGEAMSAEASVLFDAPGAGARRRYSIIAVVGSLGHPCAALPAGQALAAKGQFTAAEVESVHRTR